MQIPSENSQKCVFETSPKCLSMENDSSPKRIFSVEDSPQKTACESSQKKVSLITSEEILRAAPALGDISLGKIPPKEQRLKDSEGQKVEKLCGESEWQPRFIAITADKFIIAHPDQNVISEQIPLHEIASCDRMTGNGEDIIAFVINTIEGGYNCGRQYVFSVESEILFEEWDSFIEMQSAICFKVVNKRSPIEEFRAQIRSLLRSTQWQYTFGLIILANFIVNIGQACVEVTTVADVANAGTVTSSHRTLSAVNASDVSTQENTSDQSQMIFNSFDIAFTTLFSIELVLNLFANWFWDFFTSGWSIFDFCVVLVSIISLSVPNGPQWILVLRTMRIFRILRLFHKLRALRTIINALLVALPIVAQAFLILALCAFVFTIVGQNLFLSIAPEKFGSFGVSLYSIFEALTLDKWTSTADLVKDSRYGAEDVDPTSAIFFSVLIISCVYVLLPVIVAVLLDNFSASCKAEEKQAILDDEAEQMRKAGVSKAKTVSPLHPVLESLCKFKNSRDLSHRIYALFQALDCDRGGTLSFQEFSEGLRKMNFTPAIAISQDDFFRMTKQGELCDDEQCLDPANFEEMMRGELEDHIEHKVAQAYEESQKSDGPESTALLASVKLLKMLSHHDVHQSFSAQLDKIRVVHKQMLEMMEANTREVLEEISAMEAKVGERPRSSKPSYNPMTGPIMHMVDLGLK